MKEIDKLFYYSLIVLFIIGAIGHFVYELTGKLFLIGLFFPVNESIYEHTKLAILPLILFYLYGYLKYKPNTNKWFMTFLISLFSSIAFMPMLYYFYTGAFGFESILIDVLIFLVSITISQLLALHIYNNMSKVLNVKISLIIFMIYFIINIIFTINPPHLPIFLDKTNVTYGILKK